MKKILILLFIVSFSLNVYTQVLSVNKTYYNAKRQAVPCFKRNISET